MEKVRMLTELVIGMLKACENGDRSVFYNFESEKQIK